MADVPTSTYRTAVSVEQIGFPDPWSGFQLLDSQLKGAEPSKPVLGEEAQPPSCMEEVIGSIPIRSTNNPIKMNHFHTQTSSF